MFSKTGFKKAVLFGLFLGAVEACVHGEQTYWPHQKAYEDLLMAHSHENRTYHGLLGTFQTYWIFFSPVLVRRLLEFQADVYRWGPHQFEQNWQDWQKRQEKSAIFWLGFYVTDRRQRLMRYRSQWEISLWQKENRFEGRLIRQKVTRSQMRILVPQAHAWYEWFEVEFPVPTQEFLQASAKIVIAGPYGQHEWVIDPQKFRLD